MKDKNWLQIWLLELELSKRMLGRITTFPKSRPQEKVKYGTLLPKHFWAHWESLSFQMVV